jgi:FKBP-type peptidyl-prolyl cis-trans isomerase SlpA
MSVPTIALGSHVTLHYRVTLADNGQEVISTYGTKPATVSPGYGHLAEPLERALIGLAEGSAHQFDFAPDEAYGPRNPDLIQSMTRATLNKNSNETDYELGDLVEFPSPDGGRFAGVLKELSAERAVFDFNHPLAGRPICFEVTIIGVL